MMAAFGVFVAELRSLRRRTFLWCCVAAAGGAGVAAYLRFFVVHYPVRGYSSTHAAVDPRFLVDAFGTCVLGVMLFGAIFMAFDGRVRDEQARIAQVIESRAISTIDLLVGRLAALVLTTWLATVLLTAAVPVGVALGFAATVGPVAGVPAPMSLISFALVDALPALTLWGATVTLLAASLRNRLLVAGAALLLLGSQCYWLLHTPLHLLAVASLVGDPSAIVSDLMPRFADGRVLAQRGCLLLLAAGFVALAAGTYPRLDDRKARALGGGSVFVVLGLSGLLAVVVAALGVLEERDGWAQLHAERRDAPRADVEHVEGRLVIEPGRQMALEIEMRMRLAEDQAELALSFNPGLAVEELRVDGAPATYRHASGLLTVELLSAMEEVVLSLRAGGVPAAHFAYLDSATDATRRTLANSLLHVLGTEGSVFHSRYVALMPAARWLPMPGANFETDGLAHRDFFTLDLEVVVPSGWLVAGLGRTEPIEGDADRRFRLRPSAPVPEVAVFASRFARRAFDVAGVEFELLMHPSHLANVAVLEGTHDALAAQIEFAFDAASRLGLPYPFDSLTIVEVPGPLRTYAGGSRIESAQPLPGVLLLREHGFPTAVFPPGVRDLEASARIAALRYYFDGDFSGGSPLVGALRNISRFRATSTSAAENLVLEKLTFQALAPWFDVQRDPSAPRLFALEETNATPFSWAMTDPALVHRKARNEGKRPTVLDLVERVPLNALVAGSTPAEAAALALKAEGIARTIIAEAGSEATSALLGELGRRYAGTHFDNADVARLADELGTPLPLQEWMGRRSLPGFLVSPVEVFRLADDANGSPRYQTSLHVRNAEPTPGPVRVSYRAGRFGTTNPIRVPGLASLEIGIVSADPPVGIWLDPYLSLNRSRLALEVPNVDAERTVAKVPFSGARPSSWASGDRREIVVDDLDAGFAIESDGSGGGKRRSLFASRGRQAIEFDRGLPVYAEAAHAPAGRWHRLADEGWGWGRYRRTVALATPGDGRATAVFTAHLPDGGRWRLDYHLPNRERYRSMGTPTSRYGTQGRYDLRLVSADGPVILEFDASIAAPGWNHVGDFDLPSGPVRLVVSNQTEGEVVIADAIRWLPVP